MELNSIMAIMAHPDDAELGCGGTVAKWVKEGKEVRYVICTNGDKGSKDKDVSPHLLAETREDEQRKAAQVLGVKSVTFLRHRDGELEVTLAFRSELALLIRQYKPHIIVTHDPWRPYLLHPDHRAVGYTTSDAVVASRDHLFLPAQTNAGFDAHSPREIYFTFPEKPDLFIDITDTLDLKLQALEKHQSQIEIHENWREMITAMARDFGKKGNIEYGEIFKRIVL
ncbi:MAG: PIG-L deacetylase family protein [Thermodesulfobacteriota bacterium]|nr:PIG-L deacetylase family protein [Thermodesulfobacteriota bacterium]